MVGNADILIFPNIESGNTFYKTLSLFGDANMAGMLTGTIAPVVVPSRSDSGNSKYYSLVLACLAGTRKRIKTRPYEDTCHQPGSTSTKLAVYENENPIWRESIAHPSKELAGFHHINEQYEYRRKCVHDTLEKAGIPLAFDAVIARGGLLKPTPGGVYQINERIKHDLWHAIWNMHRIWRHGLPMRLRIVPVVLLIWPIRW